MNKYYVTKVFFTEYVAEIVAESGIMFSIDLETIFSRVCWNCSTKKK